MILNLEVFPRLLAAGNEGVRGKDTKRYHAGTNLVPLDLNVRRSLCSNGDVNEALRLVIKFRRMGSYKGRAGILAYQVRATLATHWVEALDLEAARGTLWVDWEVKTEIQFTIFR